LTGYLVALGAPPRQKSRDAQEEMDTAEEGGADDGDTPDRGPARPRYLPSSMGLSLLVEPGSEVLRVTARWGDYRLEDRAEEGQQEEPRWRREQHEVACDMPLAPGPPIVLAGADGLEVARHIRPTQVRGESGDRRVVAVSLFLVNRRAPSLEPGHEDEAMAFQAEIEVESATPIVARIDLSGRDGDDIDGRIADLHYRDIVDWAVGHNVSVEAEVSPDGGICHRVRTCWLPWAFVPRFIPGEITGVELGMDALASLADGAAARVATETCRPATANGHAGFYRAVEATSVTPFAPRALDRGLAPVVLAMARLGESALTPNSAAAMADQMRSQLDPVADAIRDRALGHRSGTSAAVAANVRARAASLLDDWASLAHERNSEGTTFGYAAEGASKTLLHEVLERGLDLADERERRFRHPDLCAMLSPPYYCARWRPTALRSTARRCSSARPISPRPPNFETSRSGSSHINRMSPLPWSAISTG
jgi:hypothetical protein